MLTLSQMAYCVVSNLWQRAIMALIYLYKDQTLPVVVPGPNVHLVGVYGNVQNPRKSS
jgi:hypothetical protein